MAYASLPIGPATKQGLSRSLCSLPVERTEVVQEQRRLWTQMGLNHKGVSAARDRAAANYAWLYRNDRTWLLETNRRARRKGLGPRSRVDWLARDDALRIRASIAAHEMQAQAPHRRITASRIFRALGETMVRRNAERLPALHALVLVLAESRAEYHRRRVTMALAEMATSKLPMTWSGLQRAAGLREWNSELEKFAIEGAAELQLKFRRR
jgi:hypothetical protein